MKIFLTGATGYIGSSVATHLIKQGHEVFGLVRDKGKTDNVKALGIVPAIGTLEDRELLTGYAQETDAVINTANSDHRLAVDTFIAALAGTGKTFIHTSGSSVVGDDVMGNAENPQLYNEETLFTPMDVRQERVNINNDIRIAGITKGIRSIVIVPSMIYGDCLGLNVESDQLPVVFRKSKEMNAGVYVGKGVNRWSNVHIADLVALYALTLEKAPTASYFYAENGEASYREIAVDVSKALGFGGKVISWNADEALAELGDWAKYALGSNSRVRAVHARNLLEWKPDAVSLQDWIALQKK
ncbi:NAD dependent epimerase/dehydratase family protein [Sphingobacterium spiritivorum ATCC 33300]|uniref:NAD dependent epimerase/dehydratase family protein n=1 Tax=Sphingobacterium spiritivorum ATCC 33300 TaxID=525372 RepID=C2FW24_SPHSI|nr:NAD-dependent epimerase/dehydratase family protein [Sphingobacterium spiritivorum]EEI92804.1 NAD dependent epimerase/dehydratase family protein [Sphingobacterium spiritivorum ATCC 33300]QQS96353.1 NAD-dependent epimerase/dehydratase family protein [Sphingobacterium spiritivorum]